MPGHFKNLRLLSLEFLCKESLQVRIHQSLTLLLPKLRVGLEILNRHRDVIILGKEQLDFCVGARTICKNVRALLSTRLSKELAKIIRLYLGAFYKITSAFSSLLHKVQAPTCRRSLATSCPPCNEEKDGDFSPPSRSFAARFFDTQSLPQT